MPRAPLDIGAAVAFLVALLTLGLFDVILPRGDAVDISAALAIGAVTLFDPIVAVSMVVLARVGAHLAQKRVRRLDLFLDSTAWRAVATALTASLVYRMGLQVDIRNARGPLSLAVHLKLLAVALCFVLLELALTQIASSVRNRRPFVALLLGNLPFRGWLLAAQVSVGMLSVLVFRSMSFWGLILVALLLLVMRQAFVLLLDIRQAYESIIEVLARAMEAQTTGRSGHAERVTEAATLAGRSLGMHGKDLESLRYAAMLHDVGAADTDDGTGTSDDGDHAEGDGPESRSAQVIEHLEFLAGVVPILRILEAPDTAPRAGRRVKVVSAYIVAGASEIDDRRMGVLGAEGASRADVIGRLLKPAALRELDLAIRSAEASVYRDRRETGST